MSHSNLKICSFFAGAGFLDLGFEKSDYEILFVNEIVTPFLYGYKHSRRNMGIAEPCYGYFNGDISDLLLGDQKQALTEIIHQERQKSNLVGFIGGPPCPDFSVGGKNRGKLGDHGKLSATYINLICNLQPDFFLFENVKGLWRTQKHRAFYEELKLLVKQHGYAITERLINSLEYGVPQDRERIIMIGFRKDLLNTLQKPINNFESTIIDFPWNKYITHPKEQVFAFSWPTVDIFKEGGVLPCPDQIPIELTTEFWFKKNQVEDHHNASDYFKPKAGLKKMLTIAEGDDSKKSYKRLHRWRYSPTAAYGNNEVHLHPYKVRRISVAEALAIQSLPKEFILPDDISLTNKFKMVGNGVPFMASQALARTIRYYLEGIE